MLRLDVPLDFISLSFQTFSSQDPSFGIPKSLLQLSILDSHLRAWLLYPISARRWRAALFRF